MISKKYKELIIRYLNNTLTKLEKEYFFDLIENDTSFKKEYFIQKDKRDLSYMKDKKDSFDIEKEWSYVDETIKMNNLKPQDSDVKIISLIPFWFKVAAIVLLSFGLGWIGKYYFGSLNNQKSNAYTIEVPRGQQSRLTLTDGTEVWINSHSKITIPANFSANNRKLDLIGEAYFKVIKDTKSPFYVNTNDLKVKVMGTSFNVRAYTEEKKVITTLEKGKVQLISDK